MVRTRRQSRHDQFVVAGRDVPARSVREDVGVEKDRVLPTPRYTRLFTEQLPSNTKVTTLDGVGHVPMYEAPERITDIITGFVDEYAHPNRATG